MYEQTSNEPIPQEAEPVQTPTLNAATDPNGRVSNPPLPSTRIEPTESINPRIVPEE